LRCRIVLECAEGGHNTEVAPCGCRPRQCQQVAVPLPGATPRWPPR
jgi:hypothetical protein